MTPTYKAGSTVTVVTPIPAGVTPEKVTAVEVSLRDEAGAVVGQLSPALPGSEKTLSFDIPAVFNLLGAQVRKGARQVEITIMAGDAAYIETSHYLIESVVQLTTLLNTFQTYPEALMTRSDLPSLAGWDAASDSARIAALQIAHSAMCNLRYVYRFSGDRRRRLSDFPGSNQDGLGRSTYTVTDIRNVLPFEWDDFPDDFKTALKRAQLAEANVMLAGDPIGDKRRQGIVSETIGESSMFLRQTPEVQLAVSREALQHLRGYVQFSVGIARS